MKTIYIFTNGTVLRRAGRRLLLEKQKQRLFDIPLKEVSRILIYTRTEITAQTINALFDNDISIHYLKRSGTSKGKLAPNIGNHLILRKQQYALFSQPDICLKLAKKIIGSKINNMGIILKHIYRNLKGTAKISRSFKESQKRLEYCKTPEEIMGVEGAAAKKYFQIYGSLFPEEFCFATRSHHPARDFTNAVLNLGYMTLLREIQSHLEAHLLDPYLGVLHSTNKRKPALTLDLLEEFRQPLIDLFVYKIFTLGQLNSNHYKKEDTPEIKITTEGIKTFFKLYEERMGSKDGESPGIRKLIDQQAASLKQYLLQKQPYIPLQLESMEIKNNI